MKRATHAWMYMYICAHICTQTQTQKNRHRQTVKHTHTHTHTHTLTHTHTHTHTHTEYRFMKPLLCITDDDDCDDKWWVHTYASAHRILCGCGLQSATNSINVRSKSRFNFIFFFLDPDSFLLHIIFSGSKCTTWTHTQDEAGSIHSSFKSLCLIHVAISITVKPEHLSFKNLLNSKKLSLSLILSLPLCTTSVILYLSLSACNSHMSMSKCSPLFRDSLAGGGHSNNNKVCCLSTLTSCTSCVCACVHTSFFVFVCALAHVNTHTCICVCVCVCV